MKAIKLYIKNWPTRLKIDQLPDVKIHVSIAYRKLALLPNFNLAEGKNNICSHHNFLGLRASRAIWGLSRLDNTLLLLTSARIGNWVKLGGVDGA